MYYIIILYTMDLRIKERLWTCVQVVWRSASRARRETLIFTNRIQQAGPENKMKINYKEHVGPTAGSPGAAKAATSADASRAAIRCRRRDILYIYVYTYMEAKSS